jgi:hypothetical protein
MKHLLWAVHGTEYILGVMFREKENDEFNKDIGSFLCGNCSGPAVRSGRLPR